MGNTYQTMPLDPTTNYLKYGQKFPPTQMTYDQTSNNVAAINQRNDLSQLNDLINLSNTDLDNNFISTLTSIFHVGDTIIIYESISGYISSGALLSNITIKPGTYVISKIVEGSRHPIRISKTGKAAGAWIDGMTLYKPLSGFFVEDSISTSQPLVPIFTDTKTQGFWGDDSIGLNLPNLFIEGEKVIVTKNIVGYKTSTSLKRAKFIKPGTYYIYKYVEDATHPLNITSNPGIAGTWVDTTYIEK